MQEEAIFFLVYFQRRKGKTCFLRGSLTVVYATVHVALKKMAACRTVQNPATVNAQTRSLFLTTSAHPGNGVIKHSAVA